MIKRATLLFFATALFLAAAAPAQAAFGLEEFDVTFSKENGSPELRAGSHPFEMTTSLALNATTPTTNPEVKELLPDGDIKDLTLAQIPGLAPNLTATDQCPIADFLSQPPTCTLSTVLGHIRIHIAGPLIEDVKIYNLTPPPGAPFEIGFEVDLVHVTLLGKLNPKPPYNGLIEQRNLPQIIPFVSADATIWGVPGDPAHNAERGGPGGEPKPFLTLPRACEGPLQTSYLIDSWQDPGAYLPNGDPNPADPNWIAGSTETHDENEPQGFGACGKLGFDPSISAQPTSRAASSPTGLDFSLDVDDAGLLNPADSAIADSDIEKAVLTFPEGMTANPSLAEGLEVCSEAQLAKETVDSAPGEGCPQASKVGTLEVETPLLDRKVNGTFYIAKPYENEFGSLLAFYFVLRNKDLGLIIKQAGRIEPDPQTGQLRGITEDIPQLPFSHLKLHLREGGRSPLITPSLCGTHSVKAELFPRAGGPAIVKSSTFQIVSGPNEGPCPPGGVAPFKPGFTAGSLNSAARIYSPFYVRLTRGDGEQDITKISTVLPLGLVGKIAGVAKCPDAAIAAARVKSGLEERANPSCPASSLIGRTSAGAGVGSQLTYAPGKAYLAGPYNGDPLSAVFITPAVAGPFDVGTVVVRSALALNPVTAEVELDGAASDPIPHILAGIPLSVREIEVYVDRPEFTRNPTSCKLLETKATLFGSNVSLLDPADDLPISLTSPYQAVNCAKLPFGPKLNFQLNGGSRRAAHPALHTVYRARPNDANVRRLALTLPRSEFVDNAHFRTICTRVQYAAKACPKGSIYGHVKAFTPLLDEPLEGPVYLRSSDNLLPDAVFALHGIVDTEVAVRIDSIKGRLRATVANAPDVPVSKVIVDMQGGDKGLFINSRNICKGKNRAEAKLTAQSGKRVTLKPLMQADCAKGRKASQRRR